jgi:hypothetical protein
MAGRVTRSDYCEGTEASSAWLIEALLDVAVEGFQICCRSGAAGRSLLKLADASGNGVRDAGAEEGGGGGRLVASAPEFQGGWRMPLKPPIELSNIKRCQP